MKTAFVITPHVINTINSLSAEERVAITSALAVEMILGAEAAHSLSPMQSVIYAMIKQYVHRDTARFNRLHSIPASPVTHRAV